MNAKHWHPARWKDLTPAQQIQPGDIVHNPVMDGLVDRSVAHTLARLLDEALLERGLRIDHPECVIGWVEEMEEE